MNSLPPGVQRFIAKPGELVFAFSSEAAFLGARLWVGGDAVPLRRLVSYEGPRGELFAPSQMRDLSVEALSGRRPFAELDVAEEWTVADGHTLFVRIDAAEVGQAFRLLHQGQPSVPARENFRVECLVAAHRMSGTLHLEFQDADGLTKAQRSLAIDPAMVGGTSARKHGTVSEAVPAGLGIDRVALTVEVKDLPATDGPARPYVFLSNLRVLAREEAGQLVPFVIDAPIAQQAADETGFRGLTWRGGRRWGSGAEGSAPISPPPQGAAGAAGGDAVFAQAVFARLSRADAVRLRVGDTESEMPMPEAPAVTSGGVIAPRWLVSCTRACEVTLFVDGMASGLVALDEGASSVMLPPDAMDGGEHHLELRDGYGLRTVCAEVGLLPRSLTPYASLQSLSRRPLPIGLAPQGAARYAALDAALAAGPTPEDARELAHAHHVLAAGAEHLTPTEIRPLTFPKLATPDVSVVIPAHNRFALTYACLCALRLARCEARFEVIVVDDGSTDDTVRLGEIVSGITVVRRAVPERFIRAVNAGVAVARGRYIALLNNDTEPTMGWLDALIDPFHRFDNVGLTGAMLLYPGNQLQEAGGVVGKTGDPIGYGRGGVPTDPRYRYVRETSYVSGAAMMTTRAIWDELQGLSDYLEPMYFEDTDFAFKVRESGRRVLYAPHAVVYHDEGQTAGTDTTKGFKAYQEVNRPKFKARWRGAFAALDAETGDLDRDKDFGIKGRVLVVDQHVPRADQDAGSVASLHEMRLLQSLGFKVTYLPYTMAALGSYVEDLERCGIETVTAPFFLSPAAFLEARGGEFDAVYLYRYTVARRLLDAIKRFAPRAKTILMNPDLAFLRDIRAAQADGDAAGLAAAAQTRAAELGVANRVDLALTYSPVERAVLSSHAEALPVITCPFVAEPGTTVPPFERRAGAMVLANFSRPANADAVRWFLDDVWGLGPEPPCPLHVYGAGMPADLAARARPGVTVAGHVADPATAYGAHRVFLAPERSGAGVAARAIGAMAAGVPCVLSPSSAEGLGVRAGLECLIADTPEEWRAAVGELHGDAAVWSALSSAGQRFVAERCSPEAARTALRAACVTLGLLPPEREPS